MSAKKNLFCRHTNKKIVKNIFLKILSDIYLYKMINGQLKKQ